MPVKCTTPPLVFTARPASAVTRPCHALQSPRGARIASRNPGAGVASGFKNSRRSPRAARAPALAPAANPALRPVSTITAWGAISRTVASVSSDEALSTISSSSSGVSCAHSGGSATDAAARLLWVTTTIDSMGATARGDGARMLASAPPGGRLNTWRSTMSSGADDPTSWERMTATSTGRRRFRPRATPVDQSMQTPLIERSSCLAVVPAYNEAGTVADVVQALRVKTPQLDVIVVDDGSTDETASLAECRRRARAPAPVQPRHRRRRAGRLQVRRRAGLRLHGPGRRRRAARPRRDREAVLRARRRGRGRHDLRHALQDPDRLHGADQPAHRDPPVRVPAVAAARASRSPTRRRASGSTTAGRSPCSRATTRTITRRWRPC